jgi:cell division protease FtsH
MKKYFKGLSFYVVLTVVVVFIALLATSSTKTYQMNYSELVVNIVQKNIKSMDFKGEKVEVVLKNLKENTKDKADIIKEEKEIKYEVNIPDIPTFMTIINDHVKNGEFSFAFTPPPQPPWWISILPTLAILIFVVIFWSLFVQQSQGGGTRVMSFGKSRARLSTDEKKKVTFDDVAGVQEEKEELQEIVEFLKQPKKFIEMGARIPKGVLLVGPPGTGKTLLAKAVSGEAGVPFFSISGSDFVEMFVGVGASRVRDLFEQAKKNSPCIVFIDEIDAVGRHRGAGHGGGHDEREQTLNQLLVEMDGFGINEGVIILAATNRPDILDPALLRPGRFDRQVVVGIPDVKGREEILKVHAKGKPFAEGVEIPVLAKNTVGFTGADLENMLNEAALLAARKNKKQIFMEDLEDAMIKVLMGPEKKSRVVTEKDKKLVAYHEAGHAVVSRFLETQDPIHQVSIVPRGRAGGFTMHKPNEDKSYTSKSEMLDKIVVMLGGRVAENMVLSDISTGAQNDIERATKLARNMIMRYGMSEKLGPIAFGTDQDEVFLGRDLAQMRNYSEKIAAEIDEEIRSIIDKAYHRAEELLKTNLEKLHLVAEALIEREKIEGAEFEELFAN